MALITSFLILKEEKGFIRDRNIKDGICLTSEAINLLDEKSLGGNMAIKVDVCKAFHNLNRSFPFKVLSSFGFDQRFYNWVSIILSSAHMSVPMVIPITSSLLLS